MQTFLMFYPVPVIGRGAVGGGVVVACVCVVVCAFYGAAGLTVGAGWAPWLFCLIFFYRRSGVGQVQVMCPHAPGPPGGGRGEVYFSLLDFFWLQLLCAGASPPASVPGITWSASHGSLGL